METEVANIGNQQRWMFYFFQPLESGDKSDKQRRRQSKMLFTTNLVGYNVRLMNLSGTAEKRLKKLLPRKAVGFSVTGFIGTCRGSTPCLEPANQAQPGQQTLTCGGLTFFVNEEIAEKFSTCNLDYDRSFFGKGLTATWPQCKECNCHS